MKMRRPLSVLVAVAALYANGCIGNNASLTILGLAVPDPDCGVAATTNFLPELIVDLTVARSALAAPIVRNGLIATPTGAVTGEVHTFLVEGVSVKYRSSTATKLPERFVAALGSVGPGSASSAIPFEILSARDIDILRGDRTITSLVAVIKVSGRLTDGGSISSSEVPVGIRLCRGCLQLPLPNLGCCASVEPTCLAHPGTMEAVRVPVCRIGVNELTDYCTYEEGRR